MTMVREGQGFSHPRTIEWLRTEERSDFALPSLWSWRESTLSLFQQIIQKA
jgi:hypothetical protein